jgi:hypothetical protein
MAADSTHVHYLNGEDKSMMERYNKILKAQEAFDKFLGIKDN